MLIVSAIDVKDLCVYHKKKYTAASWDLRDAAKNLITAERRGLFLEKYKKDYEKRKAEMEINKKSIIECEECLYYG